MTGKIGESKLSEICGMMSQIRSAGNYEHIVTTIEKTRKTLDELLKPENDDFDNVFLLQDSLLNLLKDKGWMTIDEYQSTYSNILEIARERFPSDDPDERDDYISFLEEKARENTIVRIN